MRKEVYFCDICGGEIKNHLRSNFSFNCVRTTEIPSEYFCGNDIQTEKFEESIDVCNSCSRKLLKPILSKVVSNHYRGKALQTLYRFGEITAIEYSQLEKEDNPRTMEN